MQNKAAYIIRKTWVRPSLKFLPQKSEFPLSNSRN